MASQRSHSSGVSVALGGEADNSAGDSKAENEKAIIEMKKLQTSSFASVASVAQVWFCVMYCCPHEHRSTSGSSLSAPGTTLSSPSL
jgi:hypothetical protein